MSTPTSDHPRKPKLKERGQPLRRELMPASEAALAPVHALEDEARVAVTANLPAESPLAPSARRDNRIRANSKREERWKKGLDWPVVLWLSFLHVAAVPAVFCFTWSGLVVAAILAWITGSLGICLGFHRYLTHGGFRTSRFMRGVLAWVGGLAGEGSALTWVSVHRQHHELSDQEGDPHSPRDGAWWSHMLWLGPQRGRVVMEAIYKRYSPDLLKDPIIVWLDRTFLLWHFVVGVVLTTAGYFYGSAVHGPAAAWSYAASWLVWGLFVRLVYVLHITWLVNSASHMWGYRNYVTTDDSRNNWLVGLLAFGEGWHNNHHAFPTMAKHGHKPWEVDITYWFIVLMEKLGLFWDVIHDVPARKTGRRTSA